MNIRNFLSALLLLLWSQNAHAQFPSFPDSNAVWMESVHDGPNLLFTYAYHMKQMDHDTLVNGEWYSTLWAGLEGQGWGLVGGVRAEADSRVYFYHPLTDSTYLLYDFDPVLGDSMEVWIGGYQTPYPHTEMMYIESIDVLFNSHGMPYKMIGIMNEAAFRGDQGITNWWIEGVGGTGGLLETSGSGSVSVYTSHDCMQYNDSIWPWGNPGICVSTMSVLERGSSGISIWPNPTAGLFTVQFPLGKAEVQEIFLYDALGRQVPISIKKNQDMLEVDIASSCKAGLYFLRTLHADGAIQVSRLVLQP